MRAIISILFSTFLTPFCQGQDLLEGVLIKEPTNQDLETAQAFVEQSKTKMDSVDLDTFINAFPKTPSQKVIREVQKFLNSGPSCKSCTSSVTMEDFSKTATTQLLPQLQVFVSLSLGDEILKRLSTEVSTVGGRLVLRGLINDSFPDTQKALHDLRIGIDIDPPAFEEFEVTQVPTFILKEGEKVDRVTGVRSVYSVLELFAEQGETLSATIHLKRLRKGSFR